MRKFIQFVTIILILLPAILLAQDQSVKPITEINVHSLGPQKLGNFPPVITHRRLDCPESLLSAGRSMAKINKIEQ